MSAWGTWSRLPVRRRFDTGVDVIDFRDLDAREYQLEIKGLRQPAAGVDLVVQLSTDGITWDETPANYVVGGGGTLSVGGLGGFPLVAAFGDGGGSPLWYAGIMQIDNFNLATQSWMEARGGRFSSSTGLRFAPVYNSQAVVWTALRIKAMSGALISHNLGCLLREKRPYSP